MGTILRLMIIAAIIWFIYSFIRRTFNPPARVEPPAATPLMKQCAHCGVNIPENESTQSQGYYFCSEAHRDSFLKLKP